MPIRSYAALQQDCSISGKIGHVLGLSQLNAHQFVYSTGLQQNFLVYVIRTMKDVFPGQSYKGGRPTITHISSH
jgi:hypothetical protein